MVKNPPANVGDVDSIPGSGRSPGGGNGNPLQESHLEIQWGEEACRLQSMRSQRAGHDLATKQQQQMPKTHWCWIFKNEKHRYGHYHQGDHRVGLKIGLKQIMKEIKINYKPENAEVYNSKNTH